MPCSKAARGTKAGAVPAFDDKIDANPCGEAIVTSIGGVDVSAHSLCLPHLGMKLGLLAINGPVVMEAPTRRSAQGETVKAAPRTTARKKPTARRR